MSTFPAISFKIKMKAIVSIENQQKIIAEIKRISWDRNPRIWLAIRLLALYPRVRPGEMVNVKEDDINLVDLYILFPQPKERETKYIHLLPGKVMSPEQIQHNVTGHASEAFKRYFLPDCQEKVFATQ